MSAALDDANGMDYTLNETTSVDSGTVTIILNTTYSFDYLAAKKCNDPSDKYLYLSTDVPGTERHSEDIAQRTRPRAASTSSRGIEDAAEIERLRLESQQLKGLLVDEIENLENSLSAREEGVAI